MIQNFFKIVSFNVLTKVAAFISISATIPIIEGQETSVVVRASLFEDFKSGKGVLPGQNNQVGVKPMFEFDAFTIPVSELNGNLTIANVAEKAVAQLGLELSAQ